MCRERLTGTSYSLGSRVPSHRWNTSKLGLVIFNLIGYALLLHWVIGNIDLQRLVDYLGGIPISGIFASLAIYLATLVLYGVRMALLLRIGFRISFVIVNLGYAMNALLPLRLGEGFKIAIGHRLYQIPLTALFAASVTEKLADLIKLLLLGAIVTAFAASSIVGEGALGPVTLASTLTIAAIALLRKYMRVLLRLLPKGGRLRRIYIELHKHFGGYPLGLVAGLTLAIGGTNIALIFVSINSYLPGVTFGLLDAISLFLILAFAVAIPSAPAGLGLFEAGAVVYLTQKVAVSDEAALVTASILHLVIVLPPLVFAAVSLICRQAPVLWRSR